MDFGYIFKIRTWSFEPYKARQELVQLERPGNLVKECTPNTMSGDQTAQGVYFDRLSLESWDSIACPVI